MRDELANAIRGALKGGAAAAVFLAVSDGAVEPHVATDVNDGAIDRVYLGDDRYPMAAFALMVGPVVPGEIAVVVRECDRRMFNELAKHGQLDLSRIVFIGIPCSQELTEACGCDHPCPPDSVIPCESSPSAPTVDRAADSEDPGERLAYWMENFARCVKCMACRNVCPMCFCNKCALDDPDLVGPNISPPDIPIFHLIRAVDMADRCVDCGMCEQVCLAEIPLRQLYGRARQAVLDAFGYEPGIDPDTRSPMAMLGEAHELAGMEDGFRAP